MVYDPEFDDIKTYRRLMVGQKVKSVDFTQDGDEGLEITYESGVILDFSFSGCEGSIKLKGSQL